MIGNYIPRVILTINTILLKNIVIKIFTHISYLSVKINKKFSFFVFITVGSVSYPFINAFFRGSRISNRITVLSQSKYNAKNRFDNKGSRAYHTFLIRAFKKILFFVFSGLLIALCVCFNINTIFQ